MIDLRQLRYFITVVTEKASLAPPTSWAFSNHRYQFKSKLEDRVGVKLLNNPGAALNQHRQDAPFTTIAWTF